MRSQSIIPFYIPGKTPLHKLHIGVKLSLLLVYSIIIFSTSSLLALFLYLIIFVGITIRSRLLIRSRVIHLLAILFIIFAYLTKNSTIIILALGISKIAILTLLLDLFSMTTPYRDIMQLLSSSAPFIREINSIIYVANTTITIMPSIQYELLRAIDAETIRRGSSVKLYSFDSWVTILIVLVARTMIRAERFTDAVLDRGYIPSQRLVLSNTRPFSWSDFLIMVVLLAGGLIIRVYA